MKLIFNNLHVFVFSFRIVMLYEKVQIRSKPRIKYTIRTIRLEKIIFNNAFRLSIHAVYILHVVSLALGRTPVSQNLSCLGEPLMIPLMEFREIRACVMRRAGINIASLRSFHPPEGCIYGLSVAQSSLISSPPPPFPLLLSLTLPFEFFSLTVGRILRRSCFAKRSLCRFLPC